MTYAERMNGQLYGAGSVFSKAEQAAMRKGYSLKERRAISGVIFGMYPQAINQDHADKLDALNGFSIGGTRVA